MDLENIREHFREALKRISALDYTNPSNNYYGIINSNDLTKKIENEIEDLKELSNIISTFNSIKFSKDELKYIRYIDNGVLDLTALKNIHSISDKLQANMRTGKFSVVKKNDEMMLRQYASELFDYQALGSTSRIRDFLNGRFDEELAWQDGLIIKLNSENQVNSIANLNIEINQLHRVLRAFSRLNKSNESDFEIYNLKTGSLVLTVTTILGVVITLGKATNYVLDAIKKVYEIKKHAVELKKLKSDSLKDIITNLEKAATIDNTISEEIAIKLISESGYSEDDKNEVLTFLTKANEYLFKFYDEGGEIKLLVNPISKEDKAIEEVILTSYAKTKELNEGREEMKKILAQKDIKILNIKFDDENPVK